MERTNISEVERVSPTGMFESPEGAGFCPCSCASSCYWPASSLTCPERFLLNYKVCVLIQNAIGSFQALKFYNFIMD